MARSIANSAHTACNRSCITNKIPLFLASSAFRILAAGIEVKAC
jgi:hypothetical protein